MAGGRPTEYQEEYAEQAYKLCLLGMNDAELAKYFEVTEQTINNWKISHEEFFESLTRGKIIADAEVATSFNKIARGYQYNEVSYERITPKDSDDDSTMQDQYLKRITIKEVVPNQAAAMSWLKNRQPDKWRDKKEVELNDLRDKSDEEIDTELAEIIAGQED